MVDANASDSVWNTDGSPYSWLARYSPVHGFLVAFLGGLCLLGASFVLGLSPLDRADIGPGLSTKQVGYSSAINWSLGYMVVFPCAVFSLLSMIQRVSNGFSRMAGSEMFLRPDWKVFSGHNDVVRLWDKQLASNKSYLWLIVMVVVVFSVADWAYHSALPLWSGELPINFEEPDWSVAHVYGSTGMRLLNACFSLVAFTVQAIAFSLLAAYLVFIVTLVHFSELGQLGHYFRIVPNPEAEDSRKGFELLEPGLVHLFNLGLLALGMLYLSRYWNAYLRAETTSLWTFAKPHVTFGLAGGAGIIGWFSGLAGELRDVSSVVVLGVGLLIALVVLALPFAFLRNGAKQAKQALQEHADREGQFKGRTAAEVRALLAKMEFWPSNYLSSARLVLLVVFAALCLTFYQLGPLYMGVILSVVITKLVKVTRE